MEEEKKMEEQEEVRLGIIRLGSGRWRCLVLGSAAVVKCLLLMVGGRKGTNSTEYSVPHPETAVPLRTRCSGEWTGPGWTATSHLRYLCWIDGWRYKYLYFGVVLLVEGHFVSDQPSTGQTPWRLHQRGCGNTHPSTIPRYLNPGGPRTEQILDPRTHGTAPAASKRVAQSSYWL